MLLPDTRIDRWERKYPPVLTKTDFVRRFFQNEFGNRGQNWNTLDEFLGANYTGLVHLRNRTPGGATYYNIPATEVSCKWSTLRDYRNWYLAAMAPHDCNLIQGEVWVDTRLYLAYTTVKKLPMREALAKCTQRAEGIIGVSLLKQYLCANSYDWLQVLLKRYPGHVVEFSTFSKCWGTLPHYNTVWWEIRNY